MFTKSFINLMIRLSKLLFLSIFLTGLNFLVYPSAVWAQNPQMHFCKLTGGQFFSIGLEGDMVGVCFEGAAVIDSLSLMKDVTNQGETAAVVGLASGKDCFELNGKIVFSTDPTFSSTAICRFDDNSFIGALSLGKPPTGHNDQLLRALQQKY